jgi:hypothetical protein
MNDHTHLAKAIAVALLASLALLSLEATAQSVPWSTIDSGAARVSTELYTLDATIGQPDASTPNAANGLSLTGGFWPVATLADLEVQATAITEPVVADSVAEYAVTVLNRGAASTTAALTINLSQQLSTAITSGCAEDPAGVPLCTLPSLSPGQTYSVILQARSASLLSPSLSSGFEVVGLAFDSDPDDNIILLETPTSAGDNQSSRIFHDRFQQ